MDDFGSDQRILRELRSAASLSQQELMKKTGLSERAVKYAIKRLAPEISVFINFGDMRRKRYATRKNFITHADK